jgi:hypothetical protein
LVFDTLDRRRFLIRLAHGAAVAAWTGSGLELGCAMPSLAAAAVAPPGGVELLSHPIILRSGDVLADRRFALAPDFEWTSVMAAIYVAGSDVVIRNVELVGADSWQPRWDTYIESVRAPRGINSGTAGIRLQGAPGAVVEKVSIRGFPRSAINGFGVDGAVFRDISVERCFQGLNLEHYQRNHDVLVERVQARDLWGPGPGRWTGVAGAPSRRGPGQFIGSDGLVLASLRHSTVRDCSVAGEQFASIKLVNPQHTEVSGLRGVQLMIQGTSDLEWKIDKEPSTNTVVRDCTLDSRLGSGALASAGNAIQVSWHVHDLRIENCTLIAAGRAGHGIQFAVDVHGRIEGCTFDGFNGMAGIVPAHALDLVDGSTANADFAQVNQFVNQTHIQRSS